MTAEQKTRPFLVALGLGTESHHLVLQSRLALCGGELESGGAKWAGWSADGKDLLLGTLACQRCHELLVRLEEEAFLSVVKRQITVSRRRGIEVPPAEELGFEISQVEAKPIELTEAEIAAADKILEGLVADADPRADPGEITQTGSLGRRGPSNEDVCKAIVKQGQLPVLHYFDREKAPSDSELEMAIGQGYVPGTCLLSGFVVMAEINAGRNPCHGCEGPRDRCEGQPRRDEA